MALKISEVTAALTLARSAQLALNNDGSNSKASIEYLFPFYSVSLYGAVGDGSADDKPKIQAAIDAVEAVGGGTVVVPGGTYKVLSTLTILSSNVTFMLGNSATIKADAAGTYTSVGTTAYMLIVGDDVTAYKDIAILGEGLFDANNANAAMGTLCARGPLVRLTARDVSFTGATGTSGVKILGTAHELSDTAQAGSTSTTIVLAGTSSAVDDYYNGSIVVMEKGTGFGQYRFITGYVGSTKVATINTVWGVTPDNTSVYSIVGAMANTTLDNLKLYDMDEGCNFNNQFSYSVTNCSFDNMAKQDQFELVRTFSGSVTSCKFNNTGSGNACLDIFDSVYDTSISACSFHSDLGRGALTPETGIVIDAFAAHISGLTVNGCTFGGALNRGIDFVGNTVDATYSSIVVNSCIFSGLSGANPIGIQFAQGWADTISNCIFRNIDISGGRGILVRSSQTRTKPCRIINCTFDNIRTACIDIAAVPANGKQWRLEGNTFDGPASGNSLIGIWANVDNIPIYMSDNSFEGTFNNNNIQVDAGTGNIEFGLGNRGNVATDKRGVTSVADGGTIAHGLTGTPDFVQLSSTTIGDIVSFVSADATNITVAIKDEGGGSGTTANVMWEARMLVDNGTIN